MILKYQSGQEIKKGDRVLYHGDPGEIEFVVDQLTGDPSNDWHLREFGGGIMVKEPMHYGSVFIHAESIPEDEDLEFVSRAEQ